MYLSDIEESITRILSTPLGERVLEPDFGSNLYLLIDRRVDEKWKILCAKYVHEALKKHEKRVEVKRVVGSYKDGSIVLSIELKVVDSNEIKKLEVIYG